MTEPQWMPAWSRDEGAARVRTLFGRTFHDDGEDGPEPGTPDGVWSAPGRVNLVGEHTDYADGLALPVALPHRTYVALRAREDDVVRLASEQHDEPWTIRLADVEPGAVRGWGAYVAGVAWALREAGFPVLGFDAVVDSCVPAGAALASSAALECAFAVALSDVYGLGLSDDQIGRAVLAAVGRAAENTIVGSPTGGLDQSASLLCAEGHALRLDFRPGLVASELAQPVRFDLAAAGLALLVVVTGERHARAGTRHADRRACCETSEAYLGVRSLREIEPAGIEEALARLAPNDETGGLARRVRHVVSENCRVEKFVALLRGGLGAGGLADEASAERAGELLTAAHGSLRDDYEASSRELDLAVDACLGAGALGATMTGGGWGGSVVALVRADDVATVAAAVTTAFADAGLPAPAFLDAPASAGAGRDDG